MRDIKNLLLQFLSVISVLGTYESARRDNDLVYHASVPDYNSLPRLVPHTLVKAMGFEVTDSKVSGRDIFERIVTVDAHASASVYR